MSSVKIRLGEESHRTSFLKNEPIKLTEVISGRLAR